MLRKRYIEKAWRDTSIRHGFEEIDGPTFEYADLYAVKSGEGILNEVFGVFSGKDEEQRAGGGRAPYALRPEFTPTLARMYAAKAGSLPKPTKWFWQQNCFRAERPQRGRLREFGQWNVDFIGGEDTPEAKAAADADVIGCAVGLFHILGLAPRDIRIKLSHREFLSRLLVGGGVDESDLVPALSLLDRRAKISREQFGIEGEQLGMAPELMVGIEQISRTSLPLSTFRDRSWYDSTGISHIELPATEQLVGTLEANGIAEWCEVDFSIVRGLAYYTGMVFEVHEASGAERAIAGGGRYDNLIELFGGPPTPAVGFGMGDVVLSLVLQDRGLMPEGKALLDKLSEPGASLRPDVFVISNGQPESDAQLRPLVARLRREGLHARHTYKATKNIGKLLQEAAGAHARSVAIIESSAAATLKNLDTGEQQTGVPLEELGARARAAS